MANRTYCMLIDIKRDIFEIIKLKPIDTGNVLHIKFSEDGKPVDLTGQTVKFMAKKPDGTGVYNFANVIDAKAGEIEVEITNQMTAVDGELDCEIEIEGTKLITTMTFYITVDRKLNDGEFIESTNEFTVLQKAIRDAYEAIELMETKTDAKLEQLQSQVDTAISDMNETTDTKLEQVQTQVDTAIRDMNTTTDNKLSQVQSQVNTAISNMNSTTNTKLAQLQAQVNTAIEGMNETTDTKLADLQQQVTTAIASMNSKTDTKLSQVQSQVDNKLTAIQGQVDTLGSTLTKKVNDKITEVTGTQTTLINKVDAKIADIQGQFDTLETELIDIVDDKVTEVTATQNTLTSKVDAKIVELTNAVNAKITEHTSTINSKVAEVNSKLQTVDNKISEVNSTVSNANATVTVLKQDVATAIAGIDTKIATSLEGKADKNHNHDTLYLGKTAKAESAKSADAVAWGNVTGKPSTFAPATHNHDSSYLKLSGGTVTGTVNATNLQVGGANVYTTSRKPTPADIGASASNHGHNIVDLGSEVFAGGNDLNTYNSAKTWVARTLATTTNRPADYFTVLNVGANGNSNFQLAHHYGNTSAFYVRGRHDTSGNYTPWSRVYTTNDKPTPADIGASASSHTHNYAGSSSAGGSATSALACTGNSATATTLQTARTINGTSFNGSANITTANWGTARNITIGSTTKSVNGAGNVSWSLAEIGASASNHTHSYLPLSGGTMTGTLTTNGGVTAQGTVQGYALTATNKATLVGFEVSSKQNSSGSWYNRIAPIGSDGVMEIGKYLDWHYSGTETKDYHSRMSLMNWDCMEFSGAIKVNGTIYPGLNLQPGWDIGQNGSRFYTVYCNNVNQSSDRNLKEDIVYVNDKVSVFSKMKTSTPFKDFLTGDLKIATYKYKRENKLSEEELERNPEGTALEYRDEDNQIGFIAQDIINTDIGSTFVYGEEGSMSYSPSGFTAVVAKALQEEISQRDAEIAELKNRLALIEEKLGII